MQKRIFAFLMILCATLLLLPAGAFADAESADTPVTEAELPTEEALTPDADAPEMEILTSEDAQLGEDAQNPEESSENAPTSGTCGENLTWSLADGVLTISGTGAMADYSSATEVPWHDSVATVTSVVVESGITTIGNYAFVDMSSLTSAAIPEGITSIGDDAFHHCHALAGIALPAGLTAIGKAAFWECFAITSIDLPLSLTSIGNSAFYGCTGLTSCVIPGSVTTLGERAFNACHSLSSITLPDSITVIGDYTFADCLELTSIVIPDSVTTLGAAVFEGCSKLSSVTLPNSITSMSNHVFSHCRSLESIALPSGLTEIPSCYFIACSSLTSVTIPDSVTAIGSGAFSNCEALESIKLPEGVTAIGASAFSGCKALAGIELPDGVTTLGPYAFQSCEALKEIVIPDGVTALPYNLFSYCSSLECILLPTSITSIENNVFLDCDSLEVVFYTGTKEEFANIELGQTGNDDLLDAIFLRYYLESPFEDVVDTSNNWYYDAVLWAVNSRTTIGTSDTTFGPYEVCTRAQAVTFLWRSVGAPEPTSTTTSFTDIKEGTYYYDAVLWAVENNITEGTTDTTFSPFENCTRAQIVTFLYRLQGMPDVSGGTFADVAEEAYFYDAVRWASANGISNGTTDTTFSPFDECTRAQTVTFLYRNVLLSQEA